MSGKILRLLRLMVIFMGIMAVGTWIPSFGLIDDCTDQAPGCLDTSFGGGWVLTDVQPGKYAELSALAIQNINQEQRIVAAGHSYSIWTLVRYKPDGTLDPTFGTGGIVLTKNGKRSVAGERINALAIQPDNKIVAGGSLAGGGSFALIRYTENGALDATFGSGGKVVLKLDRKYGGSVGALALQSDGKILAAGTTGSFPVVVRLNSNGTLDSSFASAGKFVFSPQWEAFSTMTIQTIEGGERILAGCESSNRMVRLTPQGALDSSFGSGGIVTADFIGYGGSYWSLGVDASNRVIAVGTANLGSSYFDGRCMAIACYDSNGSLDETFNGTGKYIELISSYGSAAAIQSNGAILIVGGIDDGYAKIWRFNPDGTLDSSFGSGGFVQTNINGNTLTLSSIAQQSDNKFIAGGTCVINNLGKFAVGRYWE